MLRPYQQDAVQAAIQWIKRTLDLHYWIKLAQVGPYSRRNCKMDNRQHR